MKDGDFLFRVMVWDMVKLMVSFGYFSFYVVFYDCGVCIVYWMVLDYFIVVKFIVFMDIILIFDVWCMMDEWFVRCYYYWIFFV